MNIIKYEDKIYLVGKNGYGINLKDGYYDNYNNLPREIKLDKVKIKGYNGNIFNIKETNKCFFILTDHGSRLVTTNYIYPIRGFNTTKKIGMDILKNGDYNILERHTNNWDDEKKELPPSLTPLKVVKSIIIKS